MFRRGGVARLLGATVLLPLAVLLIGLWQAQRGAVDLEEAQSAQARLAKQVAVLESRAAPGGRPDMRAQFRWNGRTYVGPLALTQARDALGDMEDAVTVSQVRSHLPPVVIISAGLAAGLSALVLLAGWFLGWRGRASRDALLAGFSLARRALPPVLALGVLLAVAAFIPAVAFEAAALLHPGETSTGEVKLLMLAALVVLAALWVAGSALFGLRRSLAALNPDPLPILGRPVSREEAPGLWCLLDDLARRLGALRPDHVVVGLTGGFFVASGPKVLEPGGAELSGRSLYLPLPCIPLLRDDEVAAIIGHELAHFAGKDTEYSLRFLPIYAGVERSILAVAEAGGHEGAAFPLLRPALMLGVFVMERFHGAVRHWSRLREFAADAAGAAVTSSGAQARALLRTSAIRPRIEETLRAASRAPDAAAPDLVAECLRHAAAAGLDDPARHLEEEEPHPTDTHPPTRARLDALGHPPAAALLAEATAPPTPGDVSRLGDLFADPAAMGRAVTEDFLGIVRRDARTFHEQLEAAVAEVGPEDVVLHENMRGGAIVITVMGALFALAGVALLVLGLPETGTTMVWVLIVAALAVGLGLVARGALLLHRGDRPFLTLRPEAAQIAGLDRPLAWVHLLDVHVTFQGKGSATRFVLVPAAPLPARVPGGRRAKIERDAHAVTVSAVLPRGMTPEGYLELLGSYRRAAEARRHLERPEEVAGERRRWTED